MIGRLHLQPSQQQPVELPLHERHAQDAVPRVVQCDSLHHVEWVPEACMGHMQAEISRGRVSAMSHIGSLRILMGARRHAWVQSVAAGVLCGAPPQRLVVCHPAALPVNACTQPLIDFCMAC